MWQQKPYLQMTDDNQKLGLDSYCQGKHWARLGTKTTNDQGIISVEGLSNGKYKLIETKTNEEYNLLSEAG